MQRDVDVAVAERGNEVRWIGLGDILVDDQGTDLDCALGEFAFHVRGAIFTSEVKTRPCLIEMARGDEVDKIVSVAIGGAHISEARGTSRVRATLADGK